MFEVFPPGQVKLIPSLFQQRQQLVLNYMLRLKTRNLLRPYLLEAGLWNYTGSIGNLNSDGPETWHWGWEALTCDLRGHILGHWLSAAAHLIAQTNHQELLGKANYIVQQLTLCQEANSGQWCGPFSEKMLHRIAAGKTAWAPQYTLHKLLFGLLEMYTLTGNTLALKILENFADWFYDWTSPMSQEQLDNVLDFETGGMLEVWASLYEISKAAKHRTLIDRYYRRRFFDPLLEGQDVLTNKHANTQIPEILGAARAYEVTGDERFRKIVETFWNLAVTKRGTYCTGGCSCGEVWTAPFSLSARLQAPHEHCTVFNMMRLANILLRWTGDKTYADFWERNLLNAVLAQQNSTTGMVTYFLPLGSEAKKVWGSETNDFWCCHGTLMQVHAVHHDAMAFTEQNAMIISQYIPFELSWNNVRLSLKSDVTQGLSVGQRFLSEQNQSIQKLDIPIPAHRPEAYIYDLEIQGEGEFELRLRVPDWISGQAKLLINQQEAAIQITEGWVSVKRLWHNDKLRWVLPKALHVSALPDAPETVAFMDGPLVLAGLVSEERTLTGDINHPASMLQADQERHHSWWQTSTYRSKHQSSNFRFVPLYEVQDETYCVYFPIAPKEKLPSK